MRRQSSPRRSPLNSPPRKRASPSPLLRKRSFSPEKNISPKQRFIASKQEPNSTQSKIHSLHLKDRSPPPVKERSPRRSPSPQPSKTIPKRTSIKSNSESEKSDSDASTPPKKLKREKDLEEKKKKKKKKKKEATDDDDSDLGKKKKKKRKHKKHHKKHKKHKKSSKKGKKSDDEDDNDKSSLKGRSDSESSSP